MRSRGSLSRSAARQAIVWGMSIRKSIVPSLTLAFVIAACNNDPGKDKPKAQVGEAAPVTQTTAAAPGTMNVYKFSAADSKVAFVGAKVTKKHDGSFGTFSGTIQAPDGAPEKGTVTVEIDMASLTADDPKLTGHLKSPDLFDVAKFPKAKFTSTSVKAGGENGATHTVTGNLEMHGVTKAITFPATITLSAGAADVKAEFSINRKDFGVNYPGMPDDLIKDQILIKLDIKGKKGAA